MTGPHAARGADTRWVGIDLGTQSVRALLVEDDGTVVGRGTAPLTSRRDGDRHEQDPVTWWQASAEACRQALAGHGGGRIGGVAVDATSGTIALADAHGRPVTAGLMYDDARATDDAVTVNAVGADRWDAVGYGRMPVSWALPKLRWLLRHTDEVGGVRLVHQADVVTSQLAGRPVATDSGNALKTGVDLRDLAWPADVLDALEVPTSILPEVVTPGTPIGEVGADAADATGLPAGTPIAAGTTDGCAAQIGAGAVAVGDWNVVLGTTLVVKGVTTDLVRDPWGSLYCHRGPDGRWLPGGASSVGAGPVAERFPDRDLDALTAEARLEEPASTVDFPLNGRGERFPFVADDAHAFVLGRPHDDVDEFAGLLQGVALVERLCFARLGRLGADVGGRLVSTGGASANRRWSQLRADVLGRTVELVATAEPALGAAVLASTVSGRPVAEAASRMVRVVDRLEPRADVGARFDGTYDALLTALVERGWLPSRP